jgi:predicted transcriptional regulator
MQQSSVSSVLEIKEVEAVAFLVNETRANVLCPFFEQPTTINDAAKKLNVPLHSIYRKVRGAETLGLLQVIQHKKRKGRSSKLYQTTAKAFFVPARYVPLDLTIEQELTRMQQRWIDNLVAFALKVSGQKEIGLHVSSEHGRIKFSPSFDKQEWMMLGDLEPVLFENDTELFLRPEDAKALQRELTKVWETYLAKSVQGQRAYLFRMGLLEARV